jgi:hypothetical protein
MLKIKVELAKSLKWSNRFNSGNLKIKNIGLTVGHLMFKIRLLIASIDASESLFLFINNQTLVCNSDLLIHIHNRYAVNGVLNITVLKEATFGN